MTGNSYCWSKFISPRGESITKQLEETTTHVLNVEHARKQHPGEATRRNYNKKGILVPSYEDPEIEATRRNYNDIDYLSLYDFFSNFAKGSN